MLDENDCVMWKALNSTISTPVKCCGSCSALYLLLKKKDPFLLNDGASSVSHL